MTRLLVALLIALTASVLCAGPASPGPAYTMPASRGLAYAATPVDATSEAATPQFVDIARQAGVIFHHTNGASPGKHLAETMGAGGLFFDFDGDGWEDIFLVDSGSVVDQTVDKRARHRLFRNRGDGTFADITDGSGIQHRGYGMSRNR